ncbi:hypothetical protein TK43_08830 [Roseovarius sp. JS7-11]|nr:hypothetical protein TK43_08830 [Roseovarius sp. JS7-11]
MAEKGLTGAVPAMSTLAPETVHRPDCDHRAAIRQLASAAQALIGPRSQVGAAAQSRLTPSGQPAELAFLWPDADYRISLDPCPGASPETRLALCARVVAPALSSAQLATLAKISEWQQTYGARFGAWLGLRLRRGGLAHKLYLDIPEHAPWAAWEAKLAGTAQIRSSRGAVATMVGLDPLTGGTEVYFSAGRLHPADLPALARRIGINLSDAVVPALVQDLTRRSVRFALPSFDMGFSNAFADDGAGTAFTWYSTTVGLLGPDDRVRAALLSAGATRGWDMSVYRDLTSGQPPRHVLIGAAQAGQQPPAITATIATTPEALLLWSVDAGGRE